MGSPRQSRNMPLLDAPLVVLDDVLVGLGVFVYVALIFWNVFKLSFIA